MTIDFFQMFERALMDYNMTEITFIYWFLQIFISLLKVMESNLLNIVYFFLIMEALYFLL